MLTSSARLPTYLAGSLDLRTSWLTLQIMVRLSWDTRCQLNHTMLLGAMALFDVHTVRLKLHQQPIKCIGHSGMTIVCCAFGTGFYFQQDNAADTGDYWDGGAGPDPKQVQKQLQDGSHPLVAAVRDADVSIDDARGFHSAHKKTGDDGTWQLMTTLSGMNGEHSMLKSAPPSLHHVADMHMLHQCVEISSHCMDSHRQ